MNTLETPHSQSRNLERRGRCSTLRAVLLLSLLSCTTLPRPAAAQEAKAQPAPAAPGTAPPAVGLDAKDLEGRLKERVARPGGLTADEAARRAVQTSTEDRARSADVEAADAEVRRARVEYIPRLTLVGRYTRLSSITQPALAPGVPFRLPVVLDQYLGQANVVVPLSSYFTRIRSLNEAAGESQKATEWSREAARRMLSTTARLQYYAWASTELRKTITEQSVAQSRRHLDFARAGHETGRTPQADVLRAESLLAAAELLDERTRNAAHNQEEQLKTLLHDDRRGSFEIGEDLLAVPPDGKERDTEALFQEALQKRPEFRALASSRSALAARRTDAKGSALPRIDGFGNAYLGNPNPRDLPPQERWDATWDLGIQVSFSPNDLGGSDAEIRSLDAKAKRLDAERAALVDALRDEIAETLVAEKEARFALSTAERGLAAAEEAYRVRRELFELGRSTNVELIDAESDVLRARLEMVQAKVDSRIAKVRLDHAVGRDGLR